MKSDSNSQGYILKTGPTGFTDGLDMVHKKKKCKVTQSSSQRVFLTQVIRVLLLPACNTDKGLKVEQTSGV